MHDMARDLTAKQERFVELYLVSLNATDAYQQAYGCARNSADANGPKLLGNARIQSAIRARQAKLAANTGVTPERIIAELAEIGFSRMDKFSQWGPEGVRLHDSSGLEEGAARCVAEVSETTTKDGGSLRFKLHDKVGALTLIGKHLGMFADRHEFTGKDGAAIQFVVVGGKKVGF